MFHILSKKIIHYDIKLCLFVCFFPLLLWFFVFMQFYPLTRPAVGNVIDLLELLLKICFPASYSFYKRSVYFLLSEFWTFAIQIKKIIKSELSGHMGRESHKWTKSTLLNSWILKPTPLFFNYLLTSKSIDTSIKFFSQESQHYS